MSTTLKRRSCCVALLENESGSCTFGCGSVVDSDTGMCPTCRDHSANRVECETCDQAWEKWGNEWEAVGEAKGEQVRQSADAVGTTPTVHLLPCIDCGRPTTGRLCNRCFVIVKL